MPASRRSLEITDAYRAALISIYERAGAVARSNWGRIDPDDLDRTYPAFAAATVAATEVLQRTGVALTAAYVTAYVGSERDERPRPPQAGDDSGIGRAQHGAALATAIVSPLIGVKGAIKNDVPVAKALRKGHDRAVRLIQSAALSAPRTALRAAITDDDRIVGWRRVTGGGCGACLAAATGAIHKDRETLKVHSHCRCTKEPVVADVAETLQRPTGFEMFNALPTAQQDELLGQEKALLVRSGAVPFERLISTDRMEVGPDQLVEAPLGALT